MLSLIVLPNCLHSHSDFDFEVREFSDYRLNWPYMPNLSSPWSFSFSQQIFSFVTCRVFASVSGADDAVLRAADVARRAPDAEYRVAFVVPQGQLSALR